MISAGNRPGSKENLLDTSAGDAYYNNPNVSAKSKLKSKLKNGKKYFFKQNREPE